MKHLFMCFLLLVNSVAVAANQPQVTINAWLEPDKVVVPGQQVKLYIEIATDHWFSKGTQFSPITINNTIVLKRENFAINGSKRLKGQTWSTQAWVFALYPQASGEIIIPEIYAQVTVAGEKRTDVIHHLVTPLLSLQVSEADQTPENQPWVVASAVNMEQTLSIPVDSDLRVGDSLTRKITVRAQDSTAMLLPTLLTAPASKLAKGYLAPAQVIDKQHRGDYLAIRNEQVIWVIENPGQLVLAPITLYWWDTQLKALQTITLEGGTWQVKHTVASFLQMYWLAGVLLIIALAIFSYLSVYVVRHYRVKKQQNRLPNWLAVLIALAERNGSQFTLLLYRKLYRKHKLLQLSALPDKRRYDSNNQSQHQSQGTSQQADWHDNQQQWLSIYQVSRTRQSKRYPWKAAVKLWLKI